MSASVLVILKRMDSQITNVQVGSDHKSFSHHAGTEKTWILQTIRLIWLILVLWTVVIVLPVIQSALSLFSMRFFGILLTLPICGMVIRNHSSGLWETLPATVFMETLSMAGMCQRYKELSTNATMIVESSKNVLYSNSQAIATANACRIPPSVHEQVTGVLPKLPGCNEVQSGPANAVPQSGCGATTTIGTPMWPYTDVTKSKSFAYLGCGSDLPGQPRTLQGASLKDSTGMTIEKCIDFCNSKGYSIAGLEYSTECYCDNNMLAGRAPVPGILGGCTMPCSGNNQQICGAAGLLSLYKKCPKSSSCTNVQYPFNAGLKKRKSEERRERRQKRDSELACHSNDTSASSGSASTLCEGF
ncbi:hypothetical protein EAF04_002977 [Stromatinia cepivora]|nr:hypothetical protein EAF04_002977 [Stromatinia cepivora]